MIDPGGKILFYEPPQAKYKPPKTAFATLHNTNMQKPSVAPFTANNKQIKTSFCNTKEAKLQQLARESAAKLFKIPLSFQNNFYEENKYDKSINDFTIKLCQPPKTAARVCKYSNQFIRRNTLTVPSKPSSPLAFSSREMSLKDKLNIIVQDCNEYEQKSKKVLKRVETANSALKQMFKSYDSKISNGILNDE